MKISNFIKSSAIALCILPLLTGCKEWIDDNLDECAVDAEIDYELRLVTNVSTEINTKLDQTSDSYVKDALQNYLKDIFTDFAHDVDLSFYGAEADKIRLHQENRIMDASQKSFTLHLPVHHYLHNASANLQNNQQVSLTADEYHNTAELYQKDGDSLSTHKTGLFTARADMDVKAGISQTFHVKLYMANAATALVIDTTGSKIKNLRICTTGYANSFRIADSTYKYDKSPVIKCDELPVTAGTQRCFAAVNYPSKDTPGSKTIIETTEPFVSVGSTEGLWAWHCYATLPDGTITRTLLSVKMPLRAGQLMIVKAKLYDDGVVRTDIPTVGVSVILDWTPGGHFDPIL